jgi:membrane protein implicated in regulation of membrane protease activity
MKRERRARLSAYLGIGLGVIAIGTVVAAPAGSIWAAILGVIAILVSSATLYRLRVQATDHSEIGEYFE